MYPLPSVWWIQVESDASSSAVGFALATVLTLRATCATNPVES